MRLILSILLFYSFAVKGAICDTVPTGAPQLFGAKLYEFKNYALIDSFLMIAGGDTANIPHYPSIKYKSSDNRWYATFPYHWDRFLISTDTVNKWVQNVYSRNDSLFRLKNGAETFLNVFNKTNLNNIGLGYRWVATAAGNIKTAFGSNTILVDSSSNSNALTFKADTTVLATQYDLTQLAPHLTSTQIAYGSGTNTITSEAALNYNATNNNLSVDSIRIQRVTINPDTLTDMVMDVDNPENTAGLDSVGRFGFSQSVTTWVGWPRRDVVFSLGYNDPQATSSHKPDAGTFVLHMENDYFGRSEFILNTITHGGFSNRNFFAHFDKYSGASDWRWSISNGMQWYEYDTTSNPYLTVQSNGAVVQGENATFKVSNTNLHTGVVSGSWNIAPQGDGSVTLGTGVETNTVNFNNQMNITSGLQYNITTTLSNSNTGLLLINGSTTAGGGYPFIIDQQVSASGATAWRNYNLHNTGASAYLGEAVNGDILSIYRSDLNSNDFNFGYSGANNDFRFTTGLSALLAGTNLMTIKPTQKIGIAGVTNPQAYFHIPGGTTSVAAMSIDSGALLTSPTAYKLEASGSHLYWTDRTNTRLQLDNATGSVITSVNGQTGPAITITSGTGLTSSTVSNTVTLAYDLNSTDVHQLLNRQFTDANNSGTAETDLYTYTLGANKLINNGASLHFVIDGDFNDNTATADLKMYFGGTAFANTGSLTISSTGPWSASGWLIRKNSTTAHATITFTMPGSATTQYVASFDITGLDFTNNNIFKLTAQAGGAGGGSNDITSHSWVITFEP